MNVGENIRKIRKKRKITMKELGQKIGISEQGIGNYERGDRKPNIEILNKIAYVLSVPLDELLGNSEKRSFSSKLITAILEINYLNIAMDSSQEESFNIISEYTKISVEALRNCIENNTELPPIQLLKLIDFWNNYWNEDDEIDFETFAENNYKEIINKPLIYEKVSEILRKMNSPLLRIYNNKSKEIILKSENILEMYKNNQMEDVSQVNYTGLLHDNFPYMDSNNLIIFKDERMKLAFENFKILIKYCNNFENLGKDKKSIEKYLEMFLKTIQYIDDELKALKTDLLKNEK